MLEGIMFPIAAILYLCAIVGALIQKGLKNWSIATFAVALTIDASATVFVCIIRTGVSIWPETFHGWSGYLALLIMTVHFIWALRSRRSEKSQEFFHRWSPVAAIIWALAFISGIPG